MSLKILKNTYLLQLQKSMSIQPRANAPKYNNEYNVFVKLRLDYSPYLEPRKGSDGEIRALRIEAERRHVHPAGERLVARAGGEEGFGPLRHARHLEGTCRSVSMKGVGHHAKS